MYGEEERRVRDEIDAYVARWMIRNKGWMDVVADAGQIWSRARVRPPHVNARETSKPRLFRPVTCPAFAPDFSAFLSRAYPAPPY